MDKLIKLLKEFGNAPKVPMAISIGLILTGLFGPLVAPHSPTIGELDQSYLPPAWMSGGMSDFLLGTDGLGRDILSRLLYGARISLTLSLIAIFFSGGIGTIVGVAAGYWGGTVDLLLSRLIDISLSLPMILMAILLAVVLGPSYGAVIAVVGIHLWPRYARQIRGEVLAIKQQDFVALARVAGCSDMRIMSRHILINIVPTLLVLATLQVGYVILLESTLSFLGVGIPPPQPAWGTMVADGRGHIETAWWVSLFPGLAILLVVMALNLMGDWIRDRLDPKLQQV